MTTVEPSVPGLELARLSALVYKDQGTIQLGLDRMNLRPLAMFDHNGTEGMLVANDQWASLAFRGTQPLSVQDIFSNVGRPVRWAGKGRVHSGYLQHLNMVSHKARAAVEHVSSELPVYVTGHSLGGAVATAFAAWWYGDQWMAQNHTKPSYKLAGLVTFGAPKALDREAAESIGCLKERYVVKGDLIPWHPVSFSLVHPTKATKLKPAKFWPPTRLARHAAEGYVTARALAA